MNKPIKKYEPEPSWSEVILVVSIALAIISGTIGASKGSIIDQAESCMPQSIIEYIVPTYSLGCAITRPLDHYK